MKGKVLFHVLLFFILTSCGQDRVIYQLQEKEGVKEQYIVVFKDQLIQGQTKHDGVYVNAVTSSIEQILATRSKKVFTHSIKASVFELSSSEVEFIKSINDVKYVERDDWVSIENVQFNAPYNLDRIDQDDLPLDGSHQIASGNSEVHAYVIDTGLRVSHSEFGDRSRHGFDFVSNDSDVNDCNGHGTHVAGTLAGATYGVAKSVKVVGVRVLSCSGSGRFSDVISGIEWVTANHIKPAVANMSLGGGVSTSIDQAVQASIDSGVTYVVAAGNSRANACNFSPARVGDAITVGSTDARDQLSSFTNYGECVDIFAPGSDITSAWINSDESINTISGTSMASPLVAGAAALYLSRNPQSSPQEVKQALLDGAILGRLNGLRGDSPDVLVSTQSLLNDVDEGDDKDIDEEERDNTLADGDALTDISGFRSEEKFFKVKVEEGARQLIVRLDGGEGDADLYLKEGSVPTRFSYDCRPYKLGNKEECLVSNPMPGIYHIMLRAYSDYKRTNLSVQIEL